MALTAIEWGRKEYRSLLFTFTSSRYCRCDFPRDTPRTYHRSSFTKFQQSSQTFQRLTLDNTLLLQNLVQHRSSTSVNRVGYQYRSPDASTRGSQHGSALKGVALQYELATPDSSNSFFSSPLLCFFIVSAPA